MLKRQVFRYITTKRLKNWRGLRHHPFIVPLSTFVILFFLTMVAFIGLNGRTVGPSDARVVKLSINGKSQTILTRASTVSELIKRAKLVINEGDVVEPATDTPIIDDNFRVNIYRAHPVTVIDGDKRIQTLSAASSPRNVATQAGLTVYPEDSVKITSSDDFLREGILGQKVVIDRATPVFINLYGTPINVRTHAKTVSELVKDKGIKIAVGDELHPDPTTPLTANTQVFIIRNGTKLATVEEAIPAPTQTVDDSSLSFGTTAVRQQGSPGKRVVTYQIDLQNGREIARHEIQSIVATDPVATIIARGKAVYIPTDTGTLMSAAGIAASDYPYVNYIISRESGWCPTKWQGQVGYCPSSYQPTHDPNSSYGYGLCQSTPAIKMSSAGADWASNPVTQLKWCSGYANGRYGSWGAAYNHWLTYHNW